MIKFGFRRNLLYLAMLIIFNFLRKIDFIVIDQVIGLDGSLFLTFLMFLGELVAGLIIYLYQISFLPKKKEEATFMGIKLITKSLNMSQRDSKFKIYLLILIASFFDFVEFIMGTLYLPKYKDVSKSLAMRLSSMLTISSSLLCYYLLKLPIYRHQKCSLSIIFFCLIILIISECFFELFHTERNSNTFILVLFLVFINHFFTSYKDVVEKYLLEYDFINPFFLLMIEGIFGCIITFIYSFLENPFKEIMVIYDDTNKFILLIFLLFLFFFLSGGRNAYRVMTNKIYSPMTRTLTDSFLDPFLLVYYYLFEKDFKCGEKNEQNIFYFIINLVILIIICFCGSVYNELFILYYKNLEYDTHLEISKRASSIGELDNESEE